jgi:hypothetical protein
VIFAYHIDSTTLADGDYQLIPEPEGDISEDPGNIIGDLTEAPNPGSETLVLISLTLAPPAKASPGHKPLFLLHCNLYIHVYLFVHLSFQELYSNLSCIFQGTYVLNTRT